MFIIDFDDTLFNTEALKQARLAVIVSRGIPANVFWETYQQSRVDDKGKWVYSNERHAKMIGAVGYSYEEAKAALAETTTKEFLHQFLFSDAIYFLTLLKKYQMPMILLSLGLPAWQKEKIDATFIRDYFDTVELVDEAKEHVFARLLATEPPDRVWLFNDKIEESQKIISRFPTVRVVLKQSPAWPETVYQASGLPYFKTLTEIGTYVGNKIG